ncbi:MAG TPA: Yip1 family protein [Ktedonobacterales bacterium]
MTGDPGSEAFPPQQGGWSYGYTPYLYPQSIAGGSPYPPPPPMPFPYTPSYAPQETAPVSASLIGRMWDVITHPSVDRMRQHLVGATWGRVWGVLLLEAVITAALGFVSSVVLLLIEVSMFSAIAPPGSAGGPTPGEALVGLPFYGISAVIRIALVPIGFFFSAGIYYLLARGFGGQGSFLEQVWIFLLFQAPISVIVAIASLIPLLGSLVSLAGFIYEIVLSIFAIAATHRLTMGRASAVVLIPVLTVIVLVIGIYAAIIVVALSALPHS